MGQAHGRIPNPASGSRYHRRRASQRRRTFLDNLLNFVREKIDKHVDCAAIVRDARNRYRLQLSRKSFEEIFSEVIFSLFEILPCGEQSVVHDEIHNFMIQKLIPRSSDIFQRDLVPWRDVLRCLDTDNFSINFGYTTYLIINFQAAQRLVRYGVRFEFSSLQMYPMLRRLKTEILPLFFDDDDEELDQSLQAIHRFYMTADSRIRLCVVLLVLYVTLQMQRPDIFPKCRDELRSLKMVFRTIRQPFVTVQEILNFFYALKGLNEDDSRIQELSGKIVEYFPQSTRLLAPRSLKHLSRCEVRKHMGKTGSLPHGVWGLHIPATLQDYLLIQHIKEEHFPKHVRELRRRKRSLNQNPVAKKVKLR